MAAGMEGLSRQELRALELMQELYLNDTEGGAKGLARWAVDAFRNYLAAGCDRQEFIDRIPRLIGILSNELDYVRESCQEQADNPGEAYDAATLLKDRADDLGIVAAADGLLERLRNRSLRQSGAGSI